MKPNENYRVALVIACLALHSAAVAHGAEHTNVMAKSKQIMQTAHSTALTTRVFATGRFDAATSTIKIITNDNHFAWIVLPVNVIVVQGGKSATGEAIQEGDKLLCQGGWLDDGWGPTFQAAHVEIVGSIGDAKLQAKVAAACQAIQDSSRTGSFQPEDNDNSASAASADDAKDSDLSKNADEIEAYNNAVAPRQAAVSRGFAEVERLADAAYSDSTLQHNPAAVKAMRSAVTRYKRALDAVDSLAPVPPMLRNAELYKHRGDQLEKVYATLRLRYFGTKIHSQLGMLVQVQDKAAAMYDAAKVAFVQDSGRVRERDRITQD